MPLPLSQHLTSHPSLTAATSVSAATPAPACGANAAAAAASAARLRRRAAGLLTLRDRWTDIGALPQALEQGAPDELIFEIVCRGAPVASCSVVSSVPPSVVRRSLLLLDVRTGLAPLLPRCPLEVRLPRGLFAVR